MGQSWTPSIVPNGPDEHVYLVVECNCDGHDCVWLEANVGSTDLETVITDLMSGQYSNPQRVIAFNIAERWSQDVSEDVARELRRRGDLDYEDLSSSIEDFVERYTRRQRQLTLRLA